ncbi:DUF456 domain-containing protein [Nocardioides albertanoniae]|uniref:DUF456 domain-containing protein n=1 Tax=Nocardioides albertanoniae TaxID=1175486 RepID=UPI00115078F8|nr:DUF456 domain-containing protein [Nocardioides albertanoniae]
MSLVEVIVALVIAFGIAGIIVPILPGGALLVAAAILGWAIWLGETTGWVIFGISAALIAVGLITKYAIPGKHLKDSGMPLSTQVAGGLLAIVGFFVIPVVGIFVGFPLGIFLAELRRHGGDTVAAKTSTWTALKAVGLFILIDAIAATLATITWVVGLFLT